MRQKLAIKISVAIVGVVSLALSSGVVTLLSARHVGELIQDVITENLSSLRAAQDLEMALFVKRDLIVSFILDNGNLDRLKDFKEKKQTFYNALDQARKTAHTPSEQRILDGLEEAHQKYDVERNKMIELYQKGDQDEAIAIYLSEVSSLSQQIDRLSREFIEENKHYINSTTEHAQRQISNNTWWVTLLAGLTIGFGTFLAWLFFNGILFPLRQMVADARDFTRQRSVSATQMPMDELPAVGVYLQSLMCDVSDTRSALEKNRRRLMNTEKLASVGKLAAGVAHEMRNPLTAIKMWLFSIHKSVGHDPKLDRKFEIVSEEITRLERIVCNFLEFSRPPSLNLESQSVSSLVDKTLELFSHQIEEKKLHLVRHDAEHLPLVMADVDQLKQVLINVLDNAVGATNQEGEIQIAIDKVCEPNDLSMVAVHVQDTGHGIPQDIRERIFEPFFTTKDDGTGLGLCIAAQIMAKHGGRLVLESSTQRGTTFAVWIPLAAIETYEQNPGS